MKRIVSILLSIIIVFSLVPSVIAAESSLAVKYDITCRGTNDIEVPGGSRITVAFTIKNINDAAFSLSSLENEILYDHNFFEYLPGSEKATICGAKDITYSEGHHCVYVNTVNKADFAAEQLVVTFDLLVKETRQGKSSVIKSVFFNATDGDGTKLAKANITPVDLRVTVGETLSVYELKYVVDDKTDILNVAKDTTINLRNAPEKTGFTFEGWKINNGEVKPAGAEFTVTSDAEIKAVWKAKNSYKLTFETNGGNSVNQITGYENDVIALNQITSKSGYTFAGWYSESSLKTKVTSITLTADTTVYAKWDKESTGSSGGGGGGGGGGPAVTMHTIHFETFGGSTIPSVEKTENTTVDLSKYIPTKSGFVFAGWYLDPSLTEKVETIKITKDVTLYAKWIESDENIEVKPNYKPDILTDDHYAYIMGREDGMIHPQANLTRAEAATIFFRLLDEDVRAEAITKTNSFDDVNDSDWFNTSVSTLTHLGILNGRNEKSFAPQSSITRAELTTIVARLSDADYNGSPLFSDINGHWAKEYINTAASIGWVNGNNGLFRPDDNITRAEVMTLINRVLNRQPESETDLLPDMIAWKDNSDKSAWYYLAVCEATNSHDFEMKEDGIHERWTRLTPSPDWSSLEK